MDIKEESCFLDLCSENEGDTKDLIKKFKIETVTSSSDIKAEVEDSTCSEHEEHHLLGFNELIKENEIETKMHIKEEYCWLKSETSCINDGLKDETHEDFYATKPPGLYKQDVSSCRHLFSSEHLGNDISSNMKMDGLERESQATDSSLQCLETEQLGPKSIKTRKCSICNKGFTYLSDLNRHKLSHEGIKPHQCYICNKAFTRLSDLKKHKLIHLGIKPHGCNICNKAFTQLSSLKTHKLIHEGIKPHECNICNKTFTELSNLKRHKLIHEGIKPHRCNICNKAFTHSSHLNTHKLSHEGIKLHKCNICNKAFGQLSHLKTHKLIHEGSKSHKCDMCNKAFAQLSYLKRHLLIHQDK